MSFLDNYEASRDRNDRWWRTHPTGRIETEIIEFNAEKGYVLVKATAYRERIDLQPAGIDYAHGFLAAYQPHMKRWFVEDTVTSAIMRVMALVMGGAEKPTAETIAQVTSGNDATEPDYWNTKFGEVPSYATAEEAELSGIPSFGSSFNPTLSTSTVPECKHGARIWRKGTSKKTGKDWANYSCVADQPKQCDPIWYVFSSDGTWKVQV